MAIATNVAATAVNTISWLSETDRTIVVPVYQRQYRWDIGGCEQLLADVRAVADADPHHTHFIASILSTANDEADAAELVLIDGQQRITTLMLMVAAMQHSVRESDPALAARLQSVLVHDGDAQRTKLRPHRAWAGVFEDVVLDRRSGGDSRFDDNYAFFRSQISPDEVAHVWNGLQKLEHVAITLAAEANAQQVFESLNSTGEPLRDHELIHNYVLMGLSHAEQLEIEEEYWLPIEQNTGEAIGTFWRHYLVMRTGREVAVGGEHGVYAAFRQEFPRLDLHTLRAQAAQWRVLSDIYRVLLDPAQADDPAIGRHLGHLNTFGRGMYPLVLRVYSDHLAGDLDTAGLIATLEYVQSLLLRRAIVGLPNDRLVARLCRAREAGQDALERAIARISPSDERVRAALKYTELPHPRYVLGRLADLDTTGLDVDHVFPLAPSDAWTGDGARTWIDLGEDEQNSLRALSQTLGNLVLLEQSLAERAAGASYPEKRDALYSRSRVEQTREAASAPAWSTAAVSARTATLAEQVVRVWARPTVTNIDDDGLTPVLDAVRRRGWPRGWEREFDYVEYRGEHWEVHDVKHLFHRVFTRLWADSRDAVLSFSAHRSGPIYPAQAWNGQWEILDDEHFLYLGWDAKYMLTAVQGVLVEAGIAPEVFVKYSYIAAHM